MTHPVALTIAGSDPTGGAGIQADLKTFAAHNVHGTSIISVLTAQNAVRFELFPVPASFIAAQIDAIFETFEIKAIKIGMLAGVEAVSAVIDALDRHNAGRAIPVILDPVIRASNGGVALDDEALELVRRKLIPQTTLIKPNLAEAARLLGEQEAETIEAMKAQAEQLLLLGCSSVLLSGGHLKGAEIVDIFIRKGKIHAFEGNKLDLREIHGTGCTLTAAIAANLAKGAPLFEAVDQARRYLREIMEVEHQLDLSGDSRSLDHLARRSPCSK